ncbi:MAG: hypothetical protein WAK18_17335 [Nocardioidaceae bacterium]
MAMRSNGLTASSYTPVADLDPRLADVLLTDLRERGVAAYASPVESSSTSGFDRPEFRVDVLDRLFVDAIHAETVKTLLSDKDPGLVTSSDDLTWAQIVAGFDRPVEGDVQPWPVTEDVDWSTQDETVEAEAGDLGPADRQTDLRKWLSGRDATAASYDDQLELGRAKSDRSDADTDDPADRAERFVPEPPPPLPRLEPWQQLAWIGLIGGPVLLLAAVLFSIQLPTWITMLSVGGFIGGFVTLVATMDDRGDPDDPDHGAVV